MQAIITEEEMAHIYSCLLVGNNEFGKIKKSLAKLNREDQRVDEEIQINADLRKKFNPRAEEEARERERAKRDPAQLDIADVPGSSGETGGASRTRLAMVGDGARVWTDVELRDGLMTIDRMVLLSDIRGWTSSERDSVVRFIGESIALRASDIPNALVPDTEPEALGFVALGEERVDFLNRAGPWRCVSYPEGQDDAEVIKIERVVADADSGPDEVYAEYTDGVEAEVKCARLNRDLMKNADMPEDLLERWLGAGPWATNCDPVPGAEGEGEERWFVVLEADDVKEQATSEEDARFTAARYNRSAAGREDDGSWREPPPAKLNDEQVEEVKAAARAE